MAQSSASFTNQLWETGTNELVANTFTSLGIAVTIYENLDYDSYSTFLNGSEATGKIDANTDYLTSSVLQTFQQYV